MTTETLELGNWEKASLKVTLRRLEGEEFYRVLREVEPQRSNQTYSRRYRDACLSLERKGLLARYFSDRRYHEWRVTEKGLVALSKEEWGDTAIFLSTKLQETQEALYKEQAELMSTKSALQIELDKIRRLELERNRLLSESQSSLESGLAAKFPKLGLNRTLIEVIVLLALMEMMARFKVSSLGSEKDAENMGFTNLIGTLRAIIRDKEGREFEFRKELASVLYEFRGRLIHNGLNIDLRSKQKEGIQSFVEDLYEQLYQGS